jgi:hypothetical protein
MQPAKERDTPLPELVGYVIAASSIIVVGAFFQGPILNFIFGPATLVFCVVACAAAYRHFRGGPDTKKVAK